WSLSTLLKTPSPISSLAASSRCFIPASSLNCLIFCPIVIDLIYTCPILVKGNNYFSIYQSSGGKNGSFGFFSFGLCVGKNQMCHLRVGSLVCVVTPKYTKVFQFRINFNLSKKIQCSCGILTKFSFAF